MERVEETTENVKSSIQPSNSLFPSSGLNTKANSKSEVCNAGRTRDVISRPNTADYKKLAQKNIDRGAGTSIPIRITTEQISSAPSMNFYPENEQRLGSSDVEGMLALCKAVQLTPDISELIKHGVTKLPEGTENQPVKLSESSGNGSGSTRPNSNFIQLHHQSSDQSGASSTNTRQQPSAVAAAIRTPSSTLSPSRAQYHLPLHQQPLPPQNTNLPLENTVQILRDQQFAAQRAASRSTPEQTSSAPTLNSYPEYEKMDRLMDMEGILALCKTAQLPPDQIELIEHDLRKLLGGTENQPVKISASSGGCGNTRPFSNSIPHHHNQRQDQPVPSSTKPCQQPSAADVRIPSSNFSPSRPEYHYPPHPPPPLQQPMAPPLSPPSQNRNVLPEHAVQFLRDQQFDAQRPAQSMSSASSLTHQQPTQQYAALSSTDAFNILSHHFKNPVMEACNRSMLQRAEIPPEMLYSTLLEFYKRVLLSNQIRRPSTAVGNGGSGDNNFRVTQGPSFPQQQQQQQQQHSRQPTPTIPSYQHPTMNPASSTTRENAFCNQPTTQQLQQQQQQQLLMQPQQSNQQQQLSPAPISADQQFLDPSEVIKRLCEMAASGVASSPAMASNIPQTGHPGMAHQQSDIINSSSGQLPHTQLNTDVSWGQFLQLMTPQQREFFMPSFTKQQQRDNGGNQ